MDLMQAARFIAVFALVLLVVAGILFLAAKTGIPFGKLPGDLVFSRGNFTCAIPLLSSLLISILLTVIINIILALLRK